MCRSLVQLSLNLRPRSTHDLRSDLKIARPCQPCHLAVPGLLQISNLTKPLASLEGPARKLGVIIVSALFLIARCSFILVQCAYMQPKVHRSFGPPSQLPLATTLKHFDMGRNGANLCANVQNVWWKARSAQRTPTMDIGRHNRPTVMTAEPAEPP